MKQRINARLALISLIAIIATAVGVTLVYYGLFQTQVRSDLRLSANLLMETEVFQNAYASENKNTAALQRLSSGDLRITWIDEDGIVLFDNDTDVSGLSNHFDRPEIRQALEQGEGESTRKSDTLNMNTFYYALLLEDGTVLRVSTQARTITGVFLTAFPVIAGIAAIILLICILLGHLLTRQLLSPIEQMAEDIDDSSLTPAYKELEPFADKIRSQHEKILAAAKSRQDFTANVSHELKTPITAISGYAELIENRIVDGEAQIHAAQQIRRNAERLLSLITDIIELSELDHRELPRTFEQTDLFRIAQESVDDLQALARRKSVSLSCGGTSAGISADRSLIREMIDNLVQNAIQYNKENGTVRVYVTIDHAHPKLTVKDTGIGIPTDQQSRVFERFYRVDKSRSRETGGTGLGLANVKHIGQIHSAELSMNSTPGVGTEITVSF